MSSFAALHHRELPLLLPNAWDVPSALGFVAAGFPAVGTTSLGVAVTQGRPDGGRTTREANLALAAALRRLPVPLSVDVEDGYADDTAEVAAYVADLAGTGIAGVNLEDSTAGRLVDPRAFAEKVAAVRVHVPEVFLNARVDTYWLHQEPTIETTLARASMYVAAGADGIFVPGLSEPDAIRAVTEALPAPVNVLPVPGLTLDALAALGVRRVSTGSLPYRAAAAAAVRAAEAVRDGAALPDAVGYADLQAALASYDGGA